MSDAIDNAEVMLYAVSEAYKESGNCRLEANYAHQQDVDMIPLMVQEGYKAKGWLGLILGTRMWYPFYSCEDEDDAKFEKRVDPVAREIGERGKPRSVSEGVPPPAAAARARSTAPEPARPALAPAPEPAPAPSTPKPVARTATLNSAPAPDSSFSPSMQMSPQQLVMQPHASVGAGGTFAELTLFIEKQQALWLERDEQTQEKLQRHMEQRHEVLQQQMEAQAAQAKADMDKLRDEMTPREQPPAVTDDDLAALQQRATKLHAAQLLSDEELYAVEDLCADYVELQASVSEGGVLTKDAIYSAVGHSCAAAVKVHKLTQLSGKMGADAAFARQLKRKFL